LRFQQSEERPCARESHRAFVQTPRASSFDSHPRARITAREQSSAVGRMTTNPASSDPHGAPVDPFATPLNDGR
jgi:hypothetical protein